mmetsp:Transcript_10004/g.13606  ORF Transcript_10004/g.13606 Transcript_10004/m.13606 type:complete len:458 (+) Transcript_10004:320-1693(+)
MSEFQAWTTDPEAVASALDALWLLLGAYLVFFMQAGFAMLEAGSVRAKNTKNILLKNSLDACLGAIVWWAIGYPLAYGEGGPADNEFIGGTNFFMSEKKQSKDNYYAGWMFQWAFAAAAATIVSGAVAERCDFRAYLIYTTMITGFTYPVVVHWGWSSEGWLSPWITDGKPTMGANGMMDFAGSGIVHMTGGGAALMGAIFLGPRTGRFDLDGKVVDMPGHSSVLAALGTFILWFGWYGFNPVSTLSMEYMDVAQKVAVTTTMSAASGGLSTLLIHVACGHQVDIGPLLNGILAGLVAITAPCSVVEPYAAFFIGTIAGGVYYGASTLLKKLKIDDPLDAAPVHFFNGAWGIISIGLFANQDDTVNAFGLSSDDYGAFYGGGGKQLGVQLVGCLAIAAWTCGTSALLFGSLKAMKILRVPVSDEEKGLDMSHHGGGAYNFAEKVSEKQSILIGPVSA